MYIFNCPNGFKVWGNETTEITLRFKDEEFKFILFDSPKPQSQARILIFQNWSIHVLSIFLIVLVGRICFKIKAFNLWWSFPYSHFILTWLVCLLNYTLYSVIIVRFDCFYGCLVHVAKKTYLYFVVLFGLKSKPNFAKILSNVLLTNALRKLTIANK